MGTRFYYFGRAIRDYTGFNRRHFIGACVATGALVGCRGQQSDEDQQGRLQKLLDEAAANPDWADDNRRAANLLDEQALSLQAAPPNAAKSSTAISDQASELIVRFEVSSRGYYEKFLQNPTFPGLNSGVTIGIGYDLGYVPSAARLQEDWSGALETSDLAILAGAIGLKAEPAKTHLEQNDEIRNLEISWETATNQHKTETLPRFVSIVETALQNTNELSADSLGALVSLTMNRGPSFNAAGDRYKEMRNIAQHMMRKEVQKIPAEIRSMKRIWAGLGYEGLIRRREAEATLFEIGIT